jgi:hypothetical protein
MYTAKQGGRNLICALPDSGEDPARASRGVDVDGCDVMHNS